MNTLATTPTAGNWHTLRLSPTTGYQCERIHATLLVHVSEEDLFQKTNLVATILDRNISFWRRSYKIQSWNSSPIRWTPLQVPLNNKIGKTDINKTLNQYRWRPQADDQPNYRWLNQITDGSAKLQVPQPIQMAP